MKEFIKPARLQPGDTVAALSPSFGAPYKYPHVFELGIENLRNLFGVTVKEFRTARMSPEDLHANPRLRAQDINGAFADSTVNAVITSIGGDDSVRILPFLDLPTILANPKIFMGFSDTTILNTYLNWHGLVTFNGPSILAGFAQAVTMGSPFQSHLKAILVEGATPYEYRPYPMWTDKYLPWADPSYGGELGEMSPNPGWRWLQGNGQTRGRLFGGCIEVLEFLKGTAFWPPAEFFEEKILFFETSEDKPPVNFVKYYLRNYGSMGLFDRISGVLFGRARAYSDDEKEALYKMIVDVIAGEFGRTDIPIVANMDFGHTDPQWVLPLGVIAEIEVEGRTFRLTEAAVA